MTLYGRAEAQHPAQAQALTVLRFCPFLSFCWSYGCDTVMDGTGTFLSHYQPTVAAASCVANGERVPTG